MSVCLNMREDFLQWLSDAHFGFIDTDYVMRLVDDEIIKQENPTIEMIELSTMEKAPWDEIYRKIENICGSSFERRHFLKTFMRVCDKTLEDRDYDWMASNVASLLYYNPEFERSCYLPELYELDHYINDMSVRTGHVSESHVVDLIKEIRSSVSEEYKALTDLNN